jgi:hypothetical protein
MKNQNNLFDNLKSDWEAEWQGMPEFVQEKEEPYSMIRIRFETKEDLEDFAKIIGQKVTQKTQSMWHPKKPKDCKQNLRWRNET